MFDFIVGALFGYFAPGLVGWAIGQAKTVWASLTKD